MRCFSDEVDPAQLRSLNTAIVAGEACPPNLVRSHFSTLPDTELHNEYGPTETTVWSHHHRFGPDHSIDQPIPIGDAIPGVVDRVLDAERQPVEVGGTGELYIGGPGVSAGYLGQPELTAERFVVLDSGGQTFYRTGDLVRRLDVTTLEFVGRVDEQVKIRGFRIELGEIEAALLTDSRLRAAAVGTVETPDGLRLAAWYRPVDRAAVTSDSLRSQLRSSLPEPMIPSFYIEVDEMPLTPNGKVDRSALPEPVIKRRATAPPPGPLSGTEQQMLGLWREVMDDPTLGPDDDFFDRGGHSIMAVRLVSRIRRDLGFAVPPAQLLRSGTVRSLMSVLAVASPDEKSVQAVNAVYRHIVPMLDPDTALPNIFVIHGAGGDVLNFRVLAKHLRGLANVIGVQAAGVDGVSELHMSREDMVRDYLREIQAFQPQGPYFVAGSSIGGLIAIELARSIQDAGHVVDRVVLFDVFHPSALARTLTFSEQLSYLRAEGVGYALEDLSYQWQKYVGNRWRDYRLNRARTGKRNRSDGAIPFELRKAEITENTVHIWFGHTPDHYAGRVLLLSADETYDVWDHVPRHREWAGQVDELDVIHVPGNHETLVEEPHVAVLARRLSDALVLHGVDG